MLLLPLQQFGRSQHQTNHPKPTFLPPHPSTCTGTRRRLRAGTDRPPAAGRPTCQLGGRPAALLPPHVCLHQWREQHRQLAAAYLWAATGQASPQQPAGRGAANCASAAAGGAAAPAAAGGGGSGKRQWWRQGRHEVQTRQPCCARLAARQYTWRQQPRQQRCQRQNWWRQRSRASGAQHPLPPPWRRPPAAECGRAAGALQCLDPHHSRRRGSACAVQRGGWGPARLGREEGHTLLGQQTRRHGRIWCGWLQCSVGGITDAFQARTRCCCCTMPAGGADRPVGSSLNDRFQS